MRKLGLRGRSSPMNDATDAQREAIATLIAEAQAHGTSIFEVRYSTYIGPGCAAEQGAITVVEDGAISALVWPSGTIR